MNKPDGPNTSTASNSDAALLDLLAAELNAPEPEEEVASARVADLERRLAERNQLVEILTERLEQAANQIDRLQRSGGALKTDAPAGLSSEFLNEHRELAQRIETFHGAWEERYEGPSLRRIEASLADLAERLDQLRSPSASANSQVTSFLDQVDTDEGSDEEASATDTVESTELSGSQLVSAASHRATCRTSRIEIVLLSPSDDNLPDDVPLPVTIDLDEAEPDDLHEAVIQRDRYLNWLCQKVRSIASSLESWLRGFEAEQKGTPSGEQFRELRQLIHSQMQVLEVELSIERATLFREESRLEQEQERLTREREQFEKERGNTTSGENDTVLMKRWKRFIKPE